MATNKTEPLAKSKGGRPAFRPSAVMRRRVSIWASGGMTHEAIALGLNITTPTLRKHFAHELSVGAHARRGEVLEGLYKAARRGSFSAARVFLDARIGVEAPKSETHDVGAAVGADPIARVGKKEQQQADAVTAQQGTSWGDVLPPPGKSLQ